MEKKSYSHSSNSEFSPYRPSEITETFGFDPKDAIPTPNIQATEMVYLPLLATPDKVRIKWKRLGSYSYDFGIVDEFALYDQNDLLIYSVFVNPYAKELSDSADRGHHHQSSRPVSPRQQRRKNPRPENHRAPQDGVVTRFFDFTERHLRWRRKPARSQVMIGSNLGNASWHSTDNLPILLAGGGWKHGQHIAGSRKGSENIPLCNVFVSMLQRFGMEVDAFGSSTGTMDKLV